MKYLHTMIRISNIEKSLNFYCKGLGLKETRRIENEKGRFTLIFLAAPKQKLNLLIIGMETILGQDLEILVI
jgi:catechol 2,3-dioxygenase-like lactoylglutathione lyase family enzyme